jgi:hypothetical protein
MKTGTSVLSKPAKFTKVSLLNMSEKFRVLDPIKSIF